MGGDLINHRIGADDPADKFSPRAGGPAAAYPEISLLPAYDIINGPQDLLHRDQRSSRRPGIQTGQDLPIFLHQHGLGTG